MTDNEEAQTLRRSTRVRKQISYRALAGSPDPDPKATAEATPQRKRKARDDSDREDSYELQAEDGELERRRTSFFKKSRDAKFYVLSGENDKKKTKFAVQMKAWKNVLTKVPEALCDYTIGWGVCEGHWGANGGQTQVFERAEGYVICFLNQVDRRVRDEGMETTLRLLLGPKKSQKSVELDRYRNVMLCTSNYDGSADNSILLSQKERQYSQCRSIDTDAGFCPAVTVLRFTGPIPRSWRPFREF